MSQLLSSLLTHPYPVAWNLSQLSMGDDLLQIRILEHLMF